MKLILENHPDIGFTFKPASIKLADIEFADDIALLANSAIDAQTLLQTVEEIAVSVSLKMNESKTKFMTEVTIEGIITSLIGENIAKAWVSGQPAISLNKSGSLTLEKLLRLDSLQP